MKIKKGMEILLKGDVLRYTGKSVSTMSEDYFEFETDGKTTELPLELALAARADYLQSILDKGFWIVSRGRYEQYNCGDYPALEDDPSPYDKNYDLADHYTFKDGEWKADE